VNTIARERVAKAESRQTLAAAGSSQPEEPRRERNSNRDGGVAIELRELTKAYDARLVLDAINLTIKPGQFVAIVGRSGGGKTTLLRLISGLESPTTGAVRIDGAVSKGLQKSARLMFQDARLLPWQRVISNVGIARTECWRDEALQVLDAVGLADRAQDWPYVLSGGERQRVALARALISKPRLLLLDEPFGALDAITRGEMHKLLLELWEERGFTCILITHDVAEAVTLADRVLVLRDGHLQLDLPIGRAASTQDRAAELVFLEEIILREV
jgi:sulfonate transport system ATP-binding protein